MEQVNDQDNKEASFPRGIGLPREGIIYTESGPCIAVVHLVMKDGKIGLIMSVGETALSNSFSAMSFGTIIDSVSIYDLMMALEDTKEGPANGYPKNSNTANAV